jgi:hypothetical protein
MTSRPGSDVRSAQALTTNSAAGRRSLRNRERRVGGRWRRSHGARLAATCGACERSRGPIRRREGEPWDCRRKAKLWPGRWLPGRADVCRNSSTTRRTSTARSGWPSFSRLGARRAPLSWPRPIARQRRFRRVSCSGCFRRGLRCPFYPRHRRVMGRNLDCRRQGRRDGRGHQDRAASGPGSARQNLVHFARRNSPSHMTVRAG